MLASTSPNRNDGLPESLPEPGARMANYKSDATRNEFESLLLELGWEKELSDEWPMTTAGSRPAVDSDAKCNANKCSGSPRQDFPFHVAALSDSGDANAAPGERKKSIRFKALQMLHFASEFMPEQVFRKDYKIYLMCDCDRTIANDFIDMLRKSRLSGNNETVLMSVLDPDPDKFEAFVRPLTLDHDLTLAPCSRAPAGNGRESGEWTSGEADITPVAFRGPEVKTRPQKGAAYSMRSALSWNGCEKSESRKRASLFRKQNRPGKKRVLNLKSSQTSVQCLSNIFAWSDIVKIKIRVMDRIF
jgi:hypothetical protein